MVLTAAWYFVLRGCYVFKGFDGAVSESVVLSEFVFISEQDTRDFLQVNQNEYGEEDHGPASAGGV